MPVVSVHEDRGPHFEFTIKPIPGWGKIRYKVNVAGVMLTVQEPLSPFPNLIRHKRKYTNKAERLCFTLWGAKIFAVRIIRRAHRLESRLNACVDDIREQSETLLERDKWTGRKYLSAVYTASGIVRQGKEKAEGEENVE